MAFLLCMSVHINVTAVTSRNEIEAKNDALLSFARERRLGDRTTLELSESSRDAPLGTEEPSVVAFTMVEVCREPQMKVGCVEKSKSAIAKWTRRQARKRRSDRKIF